VDIAPPPKVNTILTNDTKKPLDHTNLIRNLYKLLLQLISQVILKKVLLQNNWLKAKLIYNRIYLERYVGWLDSLARVEKFYTGQLWQSRQPLEAPYGGLDCLTARC